MIIIISLTNLSSFLFLLLSFTSFLILTRNSFKSTKPQCLNHSQLPPGPRGWPVVGNLLQVNINRPSYQWIHRVMETMKTEIACFRFAHVHVITITSRDIIKEVLMEKDEALADRVESYSCNLLSGGYKDVIFASYGNVWKHTKKMMANKLMSPLSLNKSLNDRTFEANNLISYVFKLCQLETTVKVRDVTATYCHGMMMRLMFGRRHFDEETKDGGLGPKEKEHIDAIFRVLACLFSSNVANYIPFFRGWNVEGEEADVKQADDVINKCNDPIIDERFELWRKKCGKENVEDWLDTLITLKDDQGMYLFTVDEIRAQCKNINIAMIDNPMNNVEWTLAEMLNNPEILEKATKEIDMVIGKERFVEESDLPKLEYIKACIQESFRLHPITPFLPPHAATKDITLGGYFVPKGSQVLVSRVGFGLNPKVWEEPKAYKPERHLDVHVKDLVETNMRFITFSTGRRSCLGQRLGISMTMMLLARLLQGFQWTLPHGLTRVELVPAHDNLLMAKPLLASVKPRLGLDMYLKLMN